MPTITLIPTSHISRESIKKITATLEKEKPDCVAVELDAARYVAFKKGGGNPRVKDVGVGGFLLFWTMKRVQDWLGKKVGVLPGSDMVTAVDVARERKIPVIFIDQDIGTTFLRIKAISWREKAKLLLLLVKGLTLDTFVSREQMDLTKVPEDAVIKQAMDFLKQELPAIYRVLIAERDEHMARQIKHLSTHYPSLVAVVGAGHKEGILTRLNA